LYYNVKKKHNKKYKYIYKLHFDIAKKEKNQENIRKSGPTKLIVIKL